VVQRWVDVIVARGPAAARAAKNATGTIPIVMAPSDDPVRTGLITSLARPGGNVTGVSVLSWETEPKRLQLLKEVVPRLARAGILWTPGNPGHSLTLKEIEAPARSLGLQLHPVAVRTPDELTGAFRNMVAAHVGGAIVLGDSMLFSQRERIIDLASRHRLPVMYFRRDFAEVGGLMSYGTEVNELVRRAAYFVDRILKGTTPADLPVEQPTKFELVINLKTAKALGLTIPQSVLGQADHVIK
jgi:putative ABC transport system substrate-binding protein